MVLVWLALVLQKPLNFFSATRSAVLKVMTAIEKKEKKTSSPKQNCKKAKAV